MFSSPASITLVTLRWGMSCGALVAALPAHTRPLLSLWFYEVGHGSDTKSYMTVLCVKMCQPSWERETERGREIKEINKYTHSPSFPSFLAPFPLACTLSLSSFFLLRSFSPPSLLISFPFSPPQSFLPSLPSFLSLPFSSSLPLSLSLNIDSFTQQRVHTCKNTF